MTQIIVPAVTESTAKPIQGNTLLAYLIDRSGSMYSCWTDTIGGLNADIESQKVNDDGKTEVVVYVFDHYMGSSELIKAYGGLLKDTPVFDSNDLTYIPRGGTPLYDCVGMMIREIEERENVSENNPIFLVSIFTDGMNNHYQGYSADDVKMMVETCQGRGWTFTYFGANQDAWVVGGHFGISAGNTVSYATNDMTQTMAVSSVARTVFVAEAKRRKLVDPGAMYGTKSFFADAGQSADDYKSS